MTCPAHALAHEKSMLEPDDVDLLIELSGALSTNATVADVGAGVGTTALAVFTGNATCSVFSVDTDGSSIENARRIATEAGRLGDWFAYHQDAISAAAEFENDSVDLLLIDTLHYYEQTLAELEAWLPKVKGVIWVHDYIGEHDGVQKAVDELISRGALKTTETRGLSWVGVRV